MWRWLLSDEMVIRHGSPTLAGLKTGNLFSCTYTGKTQLQKALRSLNRRLASKGVRIVPLRVTEKTALLYLYRPGKLKEDFYCSQWNRGKSIECLTVAV